jgi:predicted dehydrogenase
MNKTYRVGIVHDTSRPGLGGHGTHLAFQGLSGVETVALADTNPEGISERLAQTGARRHYLSWEKMLDQERPDIVTVCSRLPDDHFPVIRAAVSRGCHIYCEKPLCATLTEADQIVALAKRHRVKVAVAHLGRHALVFRTMREMIAGGAIGRPLTFYGRGKEDHRGGGEDLLVLGTHILDQAVWLLGPPKAVFAQVSQHGQPLRPGDRLDTAEPLGTVAGTDLLAFLDFPGGVHGIFESRRGIHKNATRMGITVAGTDGMLSMRYDRERRLRWCQSELPPEDEAHFQESPLPMANALPECLKNYPGGIPYQNPADFFRTNNCLAAADLVLAIDEDREPAASANDARMALEIIFAIYASALTGQRVSLPLADRRHPLDI